MTMTVNGDNLRKLREAKGLSRKLLSERTGGKGNATVSELTIDRMEKQTGRGFLPRLVNALAHALNVPVHALTGTRRDIVPVQCEPIAEGRALFDLASEAEHAEFSVTCEPANEDAQAAILRIMEVVGKIARQSTVQGTKVEVQATQFQLRRDLEALARANISVYAGSFYKWMAFEVCPPRDGWSDGEAVWCPDYDPKTAHPAWSPEGAGFCPCLLVVMSELSQDEVTGEAEIMAGGAACWTRGGNAYFERNLERVMAGLPPLSYEEVERMVEEERATGSTESQPGHSNVVSFPQEDGDDF